VTGSFPAADCGKRKGRPANSLCSKTQIEGLFGTGLASSEIGAWESMQEIEAIIERYGAERRHAISILQDIQARFHYLPKDAVLHVAARLRIPLIDLYGLATFYNSFSLTPRGEHVIQVCLGTACHLKGGTRLVEALERELGIREGEVTLDGRFSFKAVRCLGACALAPLVVIDGRYQPKMTQRKLTQIVARLRRVREPAEAAR